MEMAAAAVGMAVGGYIWGAAGKQAAEEASRVATEVAVREASASAAKEAGRIAAEHAAENVTKTVAVASGVALVAGAALGAWYNRSGSTDDGGSQSNTGDNGSGPDAEITGGCCAEDLSEDDSEFVCKGFDPRPKYQGEESTSQDCKLEGAVGTADDMVIIEHEDMEEETKDAPSHRPVIKCVVCFELLGDIHVIEPCLHANVCEKCLAKITSALAGARAKCPSCRVEITSTKRIYQ